MRLTKVCACPCVEWIVHADTKIHSEVCFARNTWPLRTILLVVIAFQRARFIDSATLPRRLTCGRSLEGRLGTVKLYGTMCLQVQLTGPRLDLQSEVFVPEINQSWSVDCQRRQLISRMSISPCD